MDTQAILAKASGISIAVIGDICLDVYYFIDRGRTEISLETGLETRPVNSCKHELGGAANVAVNCRGLGAGRVEIFGILGNDVHGNVVQKLLESESIDTAGLVQQDTAWMTHVYHKIYEGRQELPRYDIGNYNQPDTETVEALLSRIEERVPDLDCVIVNEQVMHGMHSREFQAGLIEIIRKSGQSTIWFADCRNLNDAYGSTIHKLNDREALELFRSEKAGESGRDPKEEVLVRWLFQRWQHPLVMTCGENGALVYDGNAVHEVPGLHIIREIDPVGAGDAFMAGMAVSYTVGASLDIAAEIGNFTAGVCIQKLFETGHPSPQEVIEQAASPDFRYRPQLARDSRLACHYREGLLEILDASTEGSLHGDFPAVAIFDHDGTISTLRQGWETVMEKMMVRSIVGEQYERIEGVLLDKITGSVRDVIEKSTGVQTIIQMHALREMVISVGLVPEADVLKAGEYKKIFNTMLLEHIEEKRILLEKGRLSSEDLTIKGALALLRELKENGTCLYLASGTDQADVRREAAMLGYADLFDGGIYGSVGDVQNDPKRLVIRSIISRIEGESDIDPSRCIVFGDGPVEMREAKRYGLTAVGLISDERQRYGADYAKRERLILAGADLLVPDFSWRDDLRHWFGWGNEA
ncbi:PfkB family carbohydrate kinase [Marispirochaeta sp.]|uniref:PfkB family carbohydrate kinase n=1 Tax=Marispirochaeta sp. TaxID=2038653 RepID=UPI0029C8B095|nr:PfkB family carbohydrate kinase [Marispirochaeta sp.]